MSTCPMCGTERGNFGEQPKAQPSSAEAVEWKIELVPVVVRDIQDAHYVRLSIGCQRFNIGPNYLDTREDAQWFATQLDTALRRAKAPTAVPIPELQAMCDSWSHNSTDERKCADELRALIDKHGEE